MANSGEETNALEAAEVAVAEAPAARPALGHSRSMATAEHRKETATTVSLQLESRGFMGLLAVTQLAFVGLFTQLEYDDEHMAHTDTQLYTMFIDVSAMIFFGFGYLMTFLRRYGLSATGLCLITSCFCVQFSLLLQGPFNQEVVWAKVDLETVLNGLFCAAAVMISMGAVLGKVTPLQLLALALVECVLFWVNWYVYYHLIEAGDVAGGVIIHTFGAYFGIAASRLFGAYHDHKDNAPVYSSDLFSVSGTFWLFILWPSFCGAVAPAGAPQQRAVIHTFLALTGSAMGYAFVSRLMGHGKLDAVGLQNATLAGGVIMGVCCEKPMGLWAALLAGQVAGAVSSWGFLINSTSKFFGVQDVCGVNNLHGMPGLLSAILGIIVYAATAKEMDLWRQVAGLAAALGIAVVGGLVTGFAFRYLPGVGFDGAFNDKAHFEVADDYDLETSETVALSE